MGKITYTADEWAGLVPNKTQQWRAYLSSLASMPNRNLSTDQLYLMLRQQHYKCALSGVTMTCIRERYVKCWTNASVDRIVAGSKYDIENVHLVCMKVNLLKRKLTIEEFIARCHHAVARGVATEWQWYVSSFNPTE
jgi:hypothetical protein